MSTAVNKVCHGAGSVVSRSRGVPHLASGDARLHRVLKPVNGQPRFRHFSILSLRVAILSRTNDSNKSFLRGPRRNGGDSLCVAAYS